MAIISWSDLVKQTRERLDLTRPEFAALLGISMATLSNWEYMGVVPPPIYQDLVVKLYQNADEAKGMLSSDKANYIGGGNPYRNEATSRSNSDFFKGVMVGGLAVGAISLIMGMLGKKK